MHLYRHLRSLVRFTQTLKGSIVLGLSSVLLIVGIATGKAMAQSPSLPLSQTARVQIQALIREKLSRTHEQQKIHSAILYTLKAIYGDAIFKQVPSLRTFVKLTNDRTIRAIVKTKVPLTSALLQKIQATGAKILSAPPDYKSIVVLVQLTQIENIARLSEVKSIAPFLQPQLSGSLITSEGETLTANDPHQSSQVTSNVKQARSHLAAALGTSIPNIGKVTSEGDIAHGAASARSTYHIDGTGVKIGVLSDSYDNLKGAATDIKNGDLPKEGVTLVGSGDLESGGTDEGRALLQIIHDLAPGAKLYFATAYNGEANFASNIRALQKAGCSIITDDVNYYTEPVYQDGIVAQAVNDVTAQGVLYFSSAGNSGNKSQKTSGVWEGNYVDGGDAPLGLGGRVHKFDSSSVSNTLTKDSGLITLQWSDPDGKSANDYDLFILNPQGTGVIAASTNVQNGDEDPFEIVNAQKAGNQVIIINYNAAPRYLHLNTNRGLLKINTLGQISGHSAAEKAFSVAAVKAAGRTTLFKSGIAGTSTPVVVESFSSDGPRRIFYKVDGTAITPGNFLGTGGVVRQKPNIAAADGVKTAFPAYPASNLNPFYGTSAATAHAAAVAALLKSFRPTWTPDQLRNVLTTTALDIETAGVDNNSGSGIVMANLALQKARQISLRRLWYWQHIHSAG